MAREPEWEWEGLTVLRTEDTVWLRSDPAGPHVRGLVSSSALLEAASPDEVLVHRVGEPVPFLSWPWYEWLCSTKCSHKAVRHPSPSTPRHQDGLKPPRHEVKWTFSLKVHYLQYSLRYKKANEHNRKPSSYDSQELGLGWEVIMGRQLIPW